jgi:guanylate kinase
MKGKLIIFSAPSGAGKTTIVHQVMKEDSRFSFSISATSRLPRAHEQDAIDYYFLSPEQFRKKINQNEFLEWEEVYENQYYGTLRSEVERIRRVGKHVIFDVDVIGGLNIKKNFGAEALSIFVMPPSEKVLAQRLRGRGTEDEKSLQKRLSKARQELEYAPQFDVQIVNDNLDRAIDETKDVIEKFVQ